MHFVLPNFVEYLQKVELYRNLGVSQYLDINIQLDIFKNQNDSWNVKWGFRNRKINVFLTSMK